MGLYETRQEAAEACKYEAETAERYAAKAVLFAKEWNSSAAWRMADVARVAADCAMQAHEELWEMAGEDMTAEEFQAFEAAEIAFMKAVNAAKAAADSIAIA